MHFLLYYNSDILDSYGTVELLRLALLILSYRLYISGSLEKYPYEHLKNKISVNPFTLEDFDNQDLKKILIDANIAIEKVPFTKDAEEVLEKIKSGLETRIESLKEILDKDIRIKVTIPGENPYKHRLGTMYREDWKLVDSNNYLKLADELHEYITSLLVDLVTTYHDRIFFGDVLYQNASSLNYNLWSANAINYNLTDGKEIPGDYQASEMKIQGPGIYGLVVTPRYGF